MYLCTCFFYFRVLVQSQGLAGGVELRQTRGLAYCLRDQRLFQTSQPNLGATDLNPFVFRSQSVHPNNTFLNVHSQVERIKIYTARSSHLASPANMSIDPKTNNYVPGGKWLAAPGSRMSSRSVAPH